MAHATGNGDDTPTHGRQQAKPGVSVHDGPTPEPPRTNPDVIDEHATAGGLAHSGVADKGPSADGRMAADRRGVDGVGAAQPRAQVQAGRIAPAGGGGGGVVDDGVGADGWGWVEAGRSDEDEGVADDDGAGGRVGEREDPGETRGEAGTEPSGEVRSDGQTDVHERAREGVEHLQAAARELIAAARAALDVAEEVVNDPDAATSLAGVLSALGDMARRVRGGGWAPSQAPDPGPEGEQQARVERIRVT